MEFSSELTGRFNLQVRAFPDTKLDMVMDAVNSALARFEREGIRPEELKRVKARYEAAFYADLSGVLGKAFRLAQYNIFAPSPGYLNEDLSRTLAVTETDVRRVYEAYIKGRQTVSASFVPRGKADLALARSERAQVVEEPIVQGEGEFAAPGRGEIVRTPTAFDRKTEPPFAKAPIVRAPTVQTKTLSNGLRVFAIENRELPPVEFDLRFKGGLLLDDLSRLGAANLLAEMMTQGTSRKAPEELEQALDLLGASIDVVAGRESLSIRGTSLSRNFRATMALLEEILLEPRWDSTEYTLAKQRVQNALRQRQAHPVALAEDVFAKLLYGDHVLGRNPLLRASWRNTDPPLIMKISTPRRASS